MAPYWRDATTAAIALAALLVAAHCLRCNGEQHDKANRSYLQTRQSLADSQLPVPTAQQGDGDGGGLQEAGDASKSSAHAPCGRVVRYRVTAYCPCAKCCGQHADGITASGKPATGLLVAADRSIPFGTMVQIPGYGTAPVLDRGGAIKGARLDVLFATHAEALQWGVQWLDVTIYD